MASSPPRSRPSRGEHRRVGLEVAEVDLFLQPVVGPDLRGGCTLATDHAPWQHVRDQDRVRGPEGEVVGGLVLEVHGRQDRHAQSARRDDLRIRVVRERDVGPVRPGPPPQVQRPPCKRDGLRGKAAWAVATDHLDVVPAFARKLDGLRVVARRDQHLFPPPLQLTGNREEEQRMR